MDPKRVRSIEVEGEREVTQPSTLLLHSLFYLVNLVTGSEVPETYLSITGKGNNIRVKMEFLLDLVSHPQTELTIKGTIRKEKITTNQELLYYKM